MPVSHPDSNGSPPPSVTRSADGAALLPRSPAAPFAWRANAWLFAATVASVFCTSFELGRGDGVRVAMLHAAQFTAALLGILLAHEFGHYIAARIHKVDASLPFFIPLPLVSPFGTMGAVIRMRSVIPTRRALLDIGASGPLAGLAVAIPLYAWGAAHSTVVPLDTLGDQGIQLGSSLLLRLMDHVFAPATPQGTDLVLSPVAFAAWAGMFVTMINLIPVGQLDGGHVAFALFGPRQNRIAQWVHRSMLAFFFVSLGSFVARDVSAGVGLWHLGRHVANSVAWVVWFEVLVVLGSVASPKRSAEERRLNAPRAVGTLGLAVLAGAFHDRSSPLLWVVWFTGLAVLVVMEARWGALRRESTLLDHPPTGAEKLTLGRAVVAAITLAFFVLLFMPTPFVL
jgi:membrane-associated protease RseP (regulator of RpoE activity)